MRKFISILFCLALSVCCVALFSCSDMADSDEDMYEITFIQSSGERVLRYLVDGQVAAPEVTQKRGYSGKWSVSDFSQIKADTEVYAEYVPNEYTVTLDLNGGTLSDDEDLTLQVTFDADYELPCAVKEHCGFVAWKYNGGSIKNSGKWDIDKDVILVAEYREMPKFEIRFIQDGYDDIVETVYSGESLKNIPALNKKVGYTAEWSVSDFTSITQNIVVEACYTPNKYTITLNPDGGKFADGSDKEKVLDITFDSEYELPIVTKSGFNFSSWKVSDKKSVPLKGKWTVADNVKLSADYTEISVREITFIQEGYNDVVRRVEDGSVLTDIPTPQPKVGYTVTWDVTDFNDFKGNTVNAVFTPNKYTVTLNPDGGIFDDGSTNKKIVEVTFDEQYNFPDPAKYGYDFVAWKRNSASMPSSGKWTVAEDVELIAQFTEKVKHIVRFVQPESADISIQVIDGEKINKNDIPEPNKIDGYDVSWDRSDLTEIVITEDITVNIVKTPKTYTATFIVDGKILKSVSVKFNEKLVFPTIENGEVDYWLSDVITGNFVDEWIYSVASDITFRAVLKAAPVIVKCNVVIVLPEGKDIPEIKKTSFTVNVGEDLNRYLEYPSSSDSDYAIVNYYYVDEAGNNIDIPKNGEFKCPRVSELIIKIKVVKQWTDNY